MVTKATLVRTGEKMSTEKHTLVSLAKLYDEGKMSVEELKESYRNIEFTPENHTVDGVEVDGDLNNSRAGVGEAVDNGMISEKTGATIFNDVMNDLFDEGKNTVPGVALNGTPHFDAEKAALKK